MVFQDRREEKKDEIEQRVAQISRVARVTAGGRRFGFRALVVAGDKKGKVGMGIGKANDVTEAVNKAGKKAIKHMVIVPLKGETIPFEIMTRFKMTKILLKPVPHGRGVIAGGVVRDICELAGIQNVNAKILSASKSKINNAKAILKAFIAMRDIFEMKQVLGQAKAAPEDIVAPIESVTSETPGKPKRASRKVALTPAQGQS